MLPRPCRKCGRPSRNGAYCPPHEPPKRGAAGSQANPAYADPAYRRNRFKLVARTRRDGTPCCICGRPFGPEERITAEHLLPLRLSGTHDESNLGPAHAGCNTGWNRKPRPR